MADHLSSVFTSLRGSSSTEGQLASVPEESTIGFTDAFGPPPNSYRDSIRRVSVLFPEWRIRSTLSSQSDQSGSNYDSSSSVASRSNNSGNSSGSASVGGADLGTSELMKIAHRMVNDGYTQRMVRAFHSTSLTETIGPDPVLKNWFVELDVDWVLQLRPQLQLQKATAYWLQELVQRWIRALALIVASIKVMIYTIQEAPAVARFGEASISAMLGVVDTMLDVIEEDKLQVALHMYMCVSSASYMIMMMPVVSLEAQRIFDEISASLKTEENRLVEAVSSTMMNIRIDYDEISWDIEIEGNGGGIHTKIRFLVDCILSMRKACASTLKSAQSQSTVELRDAIDGTTEYLLDQLLGDSEWFSDPSLRSMFLLNNSNFVAQLLGIELTTECEKYKDFYLHFSWAHVLSYIQNWNSPGLQRRWVHTSPLAKFKSAFHKTYQTQKFWKVPDPQLRDELRRAIIERVISRYRDYLKEHPELAEQVSRGSNSPEVLEEMLEELFEG
ncbi:hypothetical protein CFC21_019889 [Triticum aestivum]|uniref:Exocyst subunit Exo70 family protein n=2 Tax=Triticum aestivum TaxID=4565 RepID=A0A3B6B7Z2_WHEAT|nr:hypothetical protein CFC21_019889 [Triticum aestivum]